MDHVRSFNVFQSIASATDQNIQRYEILSTRLYLSLLIIIMFGIFMITTIPKNQVQFTLKNVSLTDYDRMQGLHKSFSCLCSSNSIPYSTFVSFTLPTFHQVCYSSFITDKWISSVFNISESNLTISQTFLGAHFQFLANLCYYAQQALADSRINLESSHFVSTTLLSRSGLTEQINSTVELFQTKIPNDFNHSLGFIVDNILSNQLVSVYGSNWLPVPYVLNNITMTSLSYGMHYCIFIISKHKTLQ